MNLRIHLMLDNLVEEKILHGYLWVKYLSHRVQDTKLKKNSKKIKMLQFVHFPLQIQTQYRDTEKEKSKNAKKIKFFCLIDAAGENHKHTASIDIVTNKGCHWYWSYKKYKLYT